MTIIYCLINFIKHYWLCLKVTKYQKVGNNVLKSKGRKNSNQSKKKEFAVYTDL